MTAFVIEVCDAESGERIALRNIEAVGEDSACVKAMQIDDPPASFEPLYCGWFALCDHMATTTRRGPIGGGKFGEVPICDRCNDKVNQLEASHD